MMNSVNRLQKLRKMSPREIAWRTGEIVRRRRERIAYRQHGRISWDAITVAKVGGELARRAATMVPGSSAAELSRLQMTFPAFYELLRERSMHRAERLLAGACTILNREVSIAGAVDWHRDPLSDYRWPSAFHADLALYELGGRIDVKYVWELNRHQFLVDLARGWMFTRDERFASRAWELILDWIAKNPLYEGVNWTSGLEVAVRSISWLWTLAGLADWPGATEVRRAEVVRSLAEHAVYLRQHLSFYSSPYNHLIGEATALNLVGRWLSGLPTAIRWQSEGRDVLVEHGPRQFYADGLCVEQAVGYHFFTLGFLTHAAISARCSESTLHEIEPIVCRAFERAAVLQQPDGRWPAIGDVDSARSIPVLPDDFWDFRGLCSLAAVVFESPALKTTSAVPGAELYWLLGTDGIAAWHHLTDSPLPQGAVFCDAGYAVARCEQGRKRDWMLFDVGSLGDGVHGDATPSVAHGHAGALQIVLFQDGRPVTVDAGMPFYFGPREWVDHFRSAAAHNTLEVEGAAMARTAGRLAWSHACRPGRLDTNIGPDAWIARGRLHLPGRVRVERHILGLPGRGIWVADLVITDRPREVRWYWQLADGSCEVEVGGPSWSKVNLAGRMLLTWTSGHDLMTDLDVSRDDGPVGWQAPEYGQLRPAARVANRARANGTLLTVSFFGVQTPPVRVVVQGGHRLDCPLFAQRASSSVDPCAAEIEWRIGHEEDEEVFVAGPADSPSGEWTHLGGVGGWPAYRRRCREQEVGVSAS